MIRSQSNFPQMFTSWIKKKNTLKEHIHFSHHYSKTCRKVKQLTLWRGARWLSGRVSDSGARGPGFETYRRRVVSLSKTLYSPKVLVNYPGSDGSVPTWLKNGWLGRKASTQPTMTLWKTHSFEIIFGRLTEDRQTAYFLDFFLSYLARLYKSTGRAIAVTRASTSVSALVALLKMLKFLVKVFKSLCLLNPRMDLVDT